MKPVPMTVTDLNKYMKNKVAEDEFLNNVYVKGEISNFKHHYTGHMYFTLKDENSLIKCIMFKTATATLNFMPKDRNEGTSFRNSGCIWKRPEFTKYIVKQCKKMELEIYIRNMRN